MNSQIRLREILEDSCPQCDRGTVLDGYDNASCGEMIHNEAFLDQAEKALVFVKEKLRKYKGKTYMGVDEIAKELLTSNIKETGDKK